MCRLVLSLRANTAYVAARVVRPRSTVADRAAAAVEEPRQNTSGTQRTRLGAAPKKLVLGSEVVCDQFAIGSKRVRMRPHVAAAAPLLGWDDASAQQRPRCTRAPVARGPLLRRRQRCCGDFSSDTSRSLREYQVIGLRPRPFSCGRKKKSIRGFIRCERCVIGAR
jgi:hypothetical protein